MLMAANIYSEVNEQLNFHWGTPLFVQPTIGAWRRISTHDAVNGVLLGIRPVGNLCVATVMVLGILTSCTAQPTTGFRPSNRSTRAVRTGVSEIKDRNNFRDEQQAAPRVSNAPIDL
jgi:hypothetical protein